MACFRSYPDNMQQDHLADHARTNIHQPTGTCQDGSCTDPSATLQSTTENQDHTNATIVRIAAVISGDRTNPKPGRSLDDSCKLVECTSTSHSTLAPLRDLHSQHDKEASARTMDLVMGKMSWRRLDLIR
jgi:hypothetical protein